MWDKWNTCWAAVATVWACLVCLDVFGTVTAEQTAIGVVLAWITIAGIATGISVALVFLVVSVAHRHGDEYITGQNTGFVLVAWLVLCIIAAAALAALTGSAIWLKLTPIVMIGLPLFLMRHEVIDELLARDGEEVPLGEPRST